MSDWLLDVRAAWRWARGRPAATAFLLATLALTLGAGTAVYAVAHHVVLRRPPVADPDRLLWMWNARVERDRAPFSVPDLADYRAGNTTLAGLAAFTNWTANLTGSGEAERLEGVRVATDFFEVVGVQPALGRLIGAGDDRALRVAVLTDRLWRRRFGGATSMVGREIALNGAAYTVVGILPRGYLLPFRDAEIAVPLPLDSDPRRGDRGANFLRVVARLRPGVTQVEAEANLDAIGQRLRRDYPTDDAKKLGVNLVPLEREITGDARPLLLTLLAAVGLLVLVACANLANLLAVAALARRPEFALRLVLGASRWRLIRQVLVETAGVVAAGGVLGTLLAVWLVRLLVWWAGRSLPRLDSVTLSPGVLGVSALAMLGAALCGLVPALQASRSFGEDLAAGSRGLAGSSSQRRIARAFVAVQVAASLVLLSAATATIGRFAQLQRVDPGFHPARALSVQLSLPSGRYGSTAALVAFVDRLTPRLTGVTGVTDAAAISLMPLSGLLSAVDFRVVGRAEPRPDDVPQAHFRIVTPAYFRAMAISMAEGREFGEEDRGDGQSVAIVSRTLARRFWPDGGAIGGQLITGIESTPRTIVGVAADVKQFSLDAPNTADLYIPMRQMPASQAPFVAARMYWVIDTRVDPDRLADAVRREIRALDPDIATSSLQSWDRVVADSIAGRRFSAQLVSGFGQAGVVLAAIGVYGVTAFTIGRRRREIGLRIAFGATSRDILRLVLRSELKPVVVGLAAGAVLAMAAPIAFSRVLFAASAPDSWSIAIAATWLAVVATVACYFPARRSMESDPSDVLRG